MVKAGKFGNRAIDFSVNPRNQNWGLNSPAKKIWWGTVTKIREDATAQTINFRGPTWGFEWIEYAIVYPYDFAGTFIGNSVAQASVMHWYNRNPTLFLGATLGVETKSVFVKIWGR